MPAVYRCPGWVSAGAAQVGSNIPPLWPAWPGHSKSYTMKTFSAKPEAVRRDWYLVNAEGKTLGRLATALAHRLHGKHKPIYTPHVDTGDYMVVINAEKIRVTGRKLKDKIYYRHTGTIGNMKIRAAREDARDTPGARDRDRREGHAAEEPARAPNVQETQSCTWHRASARRAAAETAGAIADGH